MKWTEAKIKDAIFESIEILNLKRMPSRKELESINRGDLANKISKTLGYYGWAEELKLNVKESETKNGKKFELIAENDLREKFPSKNILQMSQNHPFDILFGESVKTDVKVGRVHNYFGVAAYTFRTSKKYGSCDLYLCYGLGEDNEIKDVFVIPVSEAKVITLNITLGGSSKYLKFIDRWDLFEKLELSNKIALTI